MLCPLFFFLMIRRPPRSTLFPYNDALPIWQLRGDVAADRRYVRLHLDAGGGRRRRSDGGNRGAAAQDRKSTRLNSSHTVISYAVFCLKKKMMFWGRVPLY